MSCGTRRAVLAVIGGGVAGLAAAAALRRQGRQVILIEASGRIGGRAHTTIPALLEAPFDHGAAWLHAAERNPLAAMARQFGIRTLDSGAERVHRTRLPGRFTVAAEDAAYAQAEAAFHERAAAALAGPDVSLAEAVGPIAALPWMPSVVNWEAPVIAAADASALSLRDWHTNLLEGSNWEVEGGLGAFIARRLAGPVQLNTVATAIDWGGPGVRVETSAGTIYADACIVTVSTGVLAAGKIRFSPALPVATQEAIDGLPMGLLSKVALRAAGADRLDVPDSCGIDQCVPAIDAPAMTIVAWPHGQDHAICFAGGSHAAELDRRGELEGFARDQLRGLFGRRADGAFRPGAVVTAWAADPWTLGAYAYARPGCAGARGVLGTPLAGGRLIFAGEATRTDGLAGTVGGAFLAGEEAATACVAE
ncbi:NAD(P)/FAD-dependent oxidoreductase [Acidisphaera sp. L21]|uniref:flavin monoamine oxidase family protein n=1 Tax=Acidisphaera sp. L21 TaxID=1641851 RepID=UPI00131E2C07|nr:NAD(P)/FAD-dependent oxidoreductase [Acidisphaera sp. L21]